VNHQSVDESDDIFEENVMPKVSLKTPENTTALYPTYDEPLESENDGLDSAFAAFARTSISCKRACSCAAN